MAAFDRAEAGHPIDPKLPELDEYRAEKAIDPQIAK
jgi:hypothetical protein